jgi:V8-like Glu-specific endopeptidase
MRIAMLLAGTALSLSMGTAHAKMSGAVGLTNPGEAGLSAAQIDAARPMINSLAAPAVGAAGPQAAPAGQVPGVMGSGGALKPQAFGTFGIPYTTTRVEVGNTNYNSLVGANFLSTSYPYRAIGKLTFSTPGGNSFCSASVIRRGLIVTAAHCVRNFGGSAFFSNWTFRPGHWGPTGATANQIAPYGTWSWRRVVIASTWANGTDTGSGAARNNDIALIALNKDATGLFIGQRTGYFTYGWNNYSFVSSARTGNQTVAAISTLGYPGLMDLGRIMQRTDGPSYLTTVGGSLQIQQGSNFTGGSSGGPWIVNFASRLPVLSGGAVVGGFSAQAIVGVTSWGTSDPNAPKDNFSSRFSQNVQFPLGNYGGYGAGNIGFLLNFMCSANANYGDGQTYAQKGFCS